MLLGPDGAGDFRPSGFMCPVYANPWLTCYVRNSFFHLRVLNANKCIVHIRLIKSNVYIIRQGRRTGKTAFAAGRKTRLNGEKRRTEKCQRPESGQVVSAPTDHHDQLNDRDSDPSHKTINSVYCTHRPQRTDAVTRDRSSIDYVHESGSEISQLSNGQVPDVGGLAR